MTGNDDALNGVNAGVDAGMGAGMTAGGDAGMTGGMNGAGMNMTYGTQSNLTT